MIKTHVTVDFYSAESRIFEKTELLKVAITKALNSLDLSVRQDSYIQFEPVGVTATVVGENFHFSIHTWPEHESCAIDLYSSQGQSFARNIAEALKQEFRASEYDIKFLDRSKNLI
jgi:S-adenosylmethionine decarboxylase